MASPARAWFVLLFVLLSLPLTANAQSGSDGTLAFGQPSIGQIAAPGATLNYNYTLTDTRAVTIQAFGQTAQPTLALLRDNAVIVSDLNAGGGFIASVSAALDAGNYVVQVGAANNTTGAVTVVIQNETPITPTPLQPNLLISGILAAGTPIALYDFDALDAESFLYIESALPDGGPTITLTNRTTQQQIAALSSPLVGARLRIPQIPASYEVRLQHSTTAASQPYTICLAATNSGGCEAGVPVTAATEVPPVNVPTVTLSTVGCTVSAANSAVNIRQSADTTAPVVGSLVRGSSADVIGISPKGAFYNILNNGFNGWVSKAVVVTNGDCGTVAVVQPPPFVPVPTATSTPAPTVTPAPKPTESGPCLIMLKKATKVYTKPASSEDNLFDQVAASAQLTPIGRLADNSWWQLGYYNSWISTGNFGGKATVSGDCSHLPVVSP